MERNAGMGLRGGRLQTIQGSGLFLFAADCGSYPVFWVQQNNQASEQGPVLNLELRVHSKAGQQKAILPVALVDPVGEVPVVRHKIIS